MITVQIKGLEELEDKLYNLPSKFARRAMREAIKPAIEIWRAEIAARAPKTGKYATGFMASKVLTKVTTSSREESGTGMVGFSTEQNPSRHEAHVPSAANEAFWYELGTVKQPARPFIRPAFDSKASAVLDLFTTKLRQLLEEVFSGGTSSSGGSSGSGGTSGRGQQRDPVTGRFM